MVRMSLHIDNDDVELVKAAYYNRAAINTTCDKYINNTDNAFTRSLLKKKDILDREFSDIYYSVSYKYLGKLCNLINNNFCFSNINFEDGKYYVRMRENTILQVELEKLGFKEEL